jgi:uncharacterized protein YeaO (DUF488 family)
MSVVAKRIYVPASGTDGYRILVDRLWPRGMSKDRARIDLWLRDVAPSTELRRWFGHAVDRWPGFVERYQAELRAHGALLDRILDLERSHDRVTLLYAARDELHNEAQVLAEVLKRRTEASGR